MEQDPTLRISSHPDVYPPSDDTFLLLQTIQVPRGARALDMGTGSGFLALHMAAKARVVATDPNPWAVKLARANVLANHRVMEVIRTSFFGGLRGRFDVIAFNPPYLPDEGLGEGTGEWIDKAWNAGPTGESVILPFLREARTFLRPEGRIFTLLSSHNPRALEVVRDLYEWRAGPQRNFDFESLTGYELW